MSRAAIGLINGALVLVCCFLMARIGTEVAAGALTVPPAEVAAAPPDTPPVARGWDQHQVILTRNLFSVSAPAPADAEPTPAEDETYERTRLPLALLATVSGAPGNSWAAVQDLETSDLRVVGVDDTLTERVEVIGIERRRIVLRNDGKLEELALDEETSSAAQRAVNLARRQMERMARARSSAKPDGDVNRADKRAFEKMLRERIGQLHKQPRGR